MLSNRPAVRNSGTYLNILREPRYWPIWVAEGAPRCTVAATLRTAGALTRFTRAHWKKPESADESAVVNHSAQWGLMPAEVYDEDKQIIVRLEAPGMDSDDFDIQVYDDVLVIRGEKRFEREKGEGEYYLLERAYGRFERAIPLPSEVEHGKAKAKYRRGILQITLPKTGIRHQSNRIKVTES